MSNTMSEKKAFRKTRFRKHRKTRFECKSTYVPSQAFQRQGKVSSSQDNMCLCCFYRSVFLYDCLLVRFSADISQNCNEPAEASIQMRKPYPNLSLLHFISSRNKQYLQFKDLQAELSATMGSGRLS